MNINKIKKINIFEIIVLSFLLIAVIINAYKIDNTLKNNVGTKLQYSINSLNDKSINYEELLNAQKTLDYIELTGISYSKKTISNDTFSKRVQTVLIDGNFFKFEKINLLKGNKFTKEDVGSGNKLVIISDTLSVKLFKSIDTIGYSVKINGDIYKIAGIYEKDKTFINRISDDPKEKIYMPYSSVNKPLSKSVQVFDVHSSKLRENQIGHELKKVVKDKLVNYNTLEKSNYIKFSFQSIRIALFLIACILVFIIAMYLVNVIKETVTFFKTRLRNGYIKEIIKNNKLQILIRVLKVSCSIAACILLIYFFSFNVVTVDKFVPNGSNIFNITFYKKIIISYFQSFNKTGIYKSFEYTYLNNVILMQIINAVVIVILFIMDTFAIYKYKLLKK